MELNTPAPPPSGGAGEASPPISLFIGTPTYGGQAATFFMASLLKLQEQCLLRGIGIQIFAIVNESLITRARNTIVHGFLKSKCTHLLFLDSDIGFRPEDIFRMVAFNLPLIGGAYPKKEINWNRVAEMAKKGAPPETLAAIGSNFVFNAINPADTYQIMEPCEVSEVGTGLMLIKREVLEAMIQHYPDDWYTGDDNVNLQQKIYRFFDCAVKGGRYLSEDYYFCHRWREMGGKVFIAPWTVCQHVGSYGFVGDIVTTAKTIHVLESSVAQQALQQAMASVTVKDASKTEDAGAGPSSSS